jgi:ABC-type antimicrobial peptide transport system ATPase subunit
MDRELKITIVGNSASGKSNIALLIKDTLSIHGIDVQINEPYDEYDEDELRSHRQRSFKGLSEGYRGTTIQLDVVQSLKQPSPKVLKDFINKES